MHIVVTNNLVEYWFTIKDKTNKIIATGFENTTPLAKGCYVTMPEEKEFSSMTFIVEKVDKKNNVTLKQI